MLTEFQFRSQFTDGFLSADDFFLSLEMFPQPVGEAVFPGLCAQQTFLKALEAEWTLDWEQNPKALFFSLTHNLWKSDRRKQARRNMIAPSSNLDDEAETVLHSEESIEESYLQKDLILEVNRIIETLPEKIRIPLTLFYLSNCSVEQISTIIKKPPGTVKSRLFKGRSLIKKRLEEAGYEK